MKRNRRFIKERRSKRKEEGKKEDYAGKRKTKS